jgi:LCP family protein required for cell wall assembly
MDENQAKGKPAWKRVLVTIAIVLLVLLLVLFALGGVLFLYLDSMMDKMNYVENETTVSPEIASSIDMEEWITIDPNGSEPTIDAGDVIFPTEPAPPEEQGDHIVNIMLVGQDARPGEPPQRSDSMILMTFNKTTGEVTMTSFLRDQYVQIPGYGNTKLCHAYSYGGMTLLNKTLANHYGVEIDGNVTINFEGFAQIIDKLGGVEIELTAREAKALNDLVAGKWSLKEGKQTLTGMQALRYSRLRHIDSDFQRTERQRKVIQSVVQAYRDRPLVEMMELLEEFLPMISTNIPKDRIYRYAVGLFPLMTQGNIGSQRLPADGTFESGLIKVSEGYMASCQFNIDFAANREILEKLFDEEPT